ncbi:hypothetical protein AOL_s00088g6 [Orbilia oligospora ATCC 24927]|uniref:Uncharacterized protein n=1 Tax=Arthrobotrys oligospora (strain ATCC 24927 / CBS 115.81 / DSM 1491) TaxID=756982 RepID=G1XHP3_ARTOA|nr:hypothetical protein AOL_s00088g6 [Orbilia oligospora ATCC 24927]EGX47291.1 hypothetical protein AOL_s00088g6 [Orbilia oligospora ATCC 24927]
MALQHYAQTIRRMFKQSPVTGNSDVSKQEVLMFLKITGLSIDPEVIYTQRELIKDTEDLWRVVRTIVVSQTHKSHDSSTYGQSLAQAGLPEIIIQRVLSEPWKKYTVMWQPIEIILLCAITRLRENHARIVFQQRTGTRTITPTFNKTTTVSPGAWLYYVGGINIVALFVKENNFGYCLTPPPSIFSDCEHMLYLFTTLASAKKYCEWVSTMMSEDVKFGILALHLEREHERAIAQHVGRIQGMETWLQYVQETNEGLERCDIICGKRCDNQDDTILAFRHRSWEILTDTSYWWLPAAEEETAESGDLVSSLELVRS